MKSLQKWRNELEVRVKALNNVRSLGQYSRHLAEFHMAEIEVPGQYADVFTEPNPANHVYLERFDGNVTILHQSHNGGQRRVTMIGNDGRKYHFLVQLAIPNITRTDERMTQLHSMFNKFFEMHSNSRRRQLKLHVPVVIPITPRVRLARDYTSFRSLGDIYNYGCQLKGMDPNTPIVTFRNTPIPQHLLGASVEEQRRTSELRREARQAIYEHICSTLVSEHILSQHMNETFSNPTALWQFKREFTIHLALTSFMSYVLFVGDRTPQKIVVALDSGEIKNVDFRPTYNQVQYLRFFHP